MGAQTNIFSFDEVKKTAGRTRPSLATQKPTTKKPAKRNSAKLSSGTKTSVSSRSSNQKQRSDIASKPARRQSSSGALAKDTSSAKRSVKNKTTRKDLTASQKQNSASNKRASQSTKKRTTPKQRSGTQAQQRQGTQSRSVQSRSAVETKSAAKVSKFSDAKRIHSKNKAEKAFTKQFGKTSSAQSSGGSRAAVYKTEMGRQHKRSHKMQGSERNGGFFSRFAFSGFRATPLFMGSMMVVVGLVLSCAFLYPSAKQFYLTSRAHDQMLAEYAALEERNDKIQSQVNTLSTTEGVEDRARSEYGWVKEGENAVFVRGLDLEEEKSNFTEGIPAGSIEAPETWYSPILDKIFGV